MQAAEAAEGPPRRRPDGPSAVNTEMTLVIRLRRCRSGH
jgi:hypothetical protein